jgi:PhnB protein
MYLPEGYGTLFPYFIVSDAEEFVTFLKNVFDATEVGRTVLNGRIANVRIRVGTSTFMISEASAEGLHATKAAYYIYVEDTDKTFAKALSHGATKIFDPMNMPYQDRQGGVVDPFGNTWWISTRLVEGTYDDQGKEF